MPPRFPPGFRPRGLRGLPADVTAPPGIPTRDIPGYDTTQTRLSQTGTFRAIPMPPELLDPGNPWYKLIEFCIDIVVGKQDFLASDFTVTNASATLVRQAEERSYFLVQNNSAASILIGFGYAPTPTTGLVLPSGGVYEPFKVPQNDVFILGTVVGAQNGVVLYANG
jgi:hypothetical protein